MRLRTLFSNTDERRCALARVLATVLATNRDVFLCGPDDDARAAVLDLAAPELVSLGCRVVRASAAVPGGLTLPGFMAQLVGRADPLDLTGDDLERGYRMLSGDLHDRVALLLDGAHTIYPATLRYIQMACRSEPGLRLVFAGRETFAAALDGAEFALLRGRLAPPITLEAPQA